MDGGASSPVRCRGSNFQFEPRQFCLQGKTAESCGFCASCHPLHNLLEFSVGKLWPQIVQGSDFCSGKWDFPPQKSAPVSDARGDFAGFPNRQNRSALADLKTLWVFNPLAGDDFLCERAAALSRSPGGWVDGMSCGDSSAGASLLLTRRREAILLREGCGPLVLLWFLTDGSAPPL